MDEVVDNVDEVHGDSVTVAEVWRTLLSSLNYFAMLVSITSMRL